MIRRVQPVFDFKGLLGVRVCVDSSLLQLIFIIMIVLGVMGGDIIWAATFIAMAIVSIYLHELGHAAGAQSQGVAVDHIMLHGAGGYCAHAKSEPKQDMITVLSGPTVNLFLWITAGPIAAMAFGDHSTAAAYATFFGKLNLWLFLFNMLPVLPLDGGRITYLALWYFLPRETAMKIAGLLGLIVSIIWFPIIIYLFIVYGFILLFFPSIKENWRRFRGEIQ
ncbi:MAG: site-2 protease family protein [Pikeienuella sp.]